MDLGLGRSEGRFHGGHRRGHRRVRVLLGRRLSRLVGRGVGLGGLHEGVEVVLGLAHGELGGLAELGLGGGPGAVGFLLEEGEEVVDLGGIEVVAGEEGLVGQVGELREEGFHRRRRRLCFTSSIGRSVGGLRSEELEWYNWLPQPCE